MKKTLVVSLTMLLSVMMTGSFALAQEETGTTEEAAATTEAPSEAAQNTEETQAPELIVVEPNLSEEGEFLLEDYSTIEIPASSVAVSDEEVNNYLDSIISYATTEQTVTEGTAESGDTVNIDFSGKLEGEEEPFEGGTAQGYALVLGSGAFIPGFEDQIIGHEIGETFDVNVTFPEEYTEELAGKNAVFSVTLNGKIITVVPEMNDEFVQNFSAENMEKQLSTVDELKEYTYNYLYTNYLNQAIMQAMRDKETVISYPEAEFELLKAYFTTDLEQYAQSLMMYGMEADADYVAQMSGYAAAEDYAEEQAMNYLGITMMLDKVAADLGIEVTQEEIDEAIHQNMVVYGYDGVYEIDQFKELMGEGWVFLMEKLNVENPAVTKALESNVVFTEDPVETEAASEAASEVSVPEETVEEETVEEETK